MIKVAIVEDDNEIRELFSSMIMLDENFKLVGSFEKAEDFLKQLEEDFADVVIMDIQLPGISGIEAIRKVKQNDTQTQFIIFTVFEDEENIFEALKSGANGYLLKSTSPSKVFEAIESVHQGGSPISPGIARKVIFTFQEKKNPEFESLTNREKEILHALSMGMRYKEISDKYFISMDTVRSHIRHIYEKLQVNSRTDALNKVHGQKLI